MPTTTFSAQQPADIAECLRGRPGRVLVFGEMGVGKSTLVAELAQLLFRAGSDHMVIGADPGLPAFGIPGAVCGGRWRGDDFQLTAWEALCSLNAGRFRLPLIQAVGRLLASIDPPLLLIDAPGVTRGVAGAELLVGLIETAAVDKVFLVVRKGKPGPLMTELKASGVAIWRVTASDKARPLSSRGRRQARTLLWDARLAGMPEIRIPLDRYPLVGTPPPIHAPQQWCGRQIALLDNGRTVAMGEVMGVDKDALRVRLPASLPPGNQLLVRDAGRGANGGLVSVAPFRPGPSRSHVPPDCLPLADHPPGPRPVTGQ